MDKQAEKEDFWTVNASKEELRSFTMNSLDGVHPDFAEIFRATPVEGMLHPPLQLRDMTPPKLPRGRVTLLGDATHAMVPFRGEVSKTGCRAALEPSVLSIRNIC